MFPFVHSLRLARSGRLAFVLFGSATITLACDDGPGIGTDQRSPDDRGGSAGAGGTATAGANQGVGGSGAAGSAQTGGTTQAGGNAQGGGSGGGGSSGASPGLCAGQPNPAGCVSQGCQPDETCTQRADVCVPSTCGCDPASGWTCTADCGGGTCVATKPRYFARIGFVSGQQPFRDWCVAYQQAADGQPVFQELGMLVSHFTAPNDFDGLRKLTRYFELDGAPIAWGFTTTGACGKEAQYLVAANAVPYQTILAMPVSGEALGMWALTDSGPANGFFVGTSARVVDALASGETLDVTLQSALPIPLGAIPFGNAPGYTSVPDGFLQRVEITRASGQKAVVDFTQFDLLSVERTTIILRGSTGDESALVCNDAKPDAGAFGEPPPDVFSSGCTVVPMK